jgi:hypothetical protein
MNKSYIQTTILIVNFNNKFNFNSFIGFRHEIYWRTGITSQLCLTFVHFERRNLKLLQLARWGSWGRHSFQQRGRTLFCVTITLRGPCPALVRGCCYRCITTHRSAVRCSGTEYVHWFKCCTPDYSGSMTQRLFNTQVGKQLHPGRTSPERQIHCSS